MSGLACATGTPVSRSLKEASGSSLEQLPYMGISSSFIHVYKSPSVAFLSPCVAVASPASRSVARSVGRLAGWPACLPAGLLRSAVVVVVSFSQLFRLCSALSTTTTSTEHDHSFSRAHTHTHIHSFQPLAVSSAPRPLRRRRRRRRRNFRSAIFHDERRRALTTSPPPPPTPRRHRRLLRLLLPSTFFLTELSRAGALCAAHRRMTNH